MPKFEAKMHLTSVSSPNEVLTVRVNMERSVGAEMRVFVQAVLDDFRTGYNTRVKNSQTTLQERSLSVLSLLNNNINRPEFPAVHLAP